MVGGHASRSGQAATTQVRADGAISKVTIDSRYGHGTMSGPVRPGARGGNEVRMPGGTWIDCGRHCDETQRRETVDFWESRDTKTNPGDGPGYLHWNR